MKEEQQIKQGRRESRKTEKMTVEKEDTGRKMSMRELREIRN